MGSPFRSKTKPLKVGERHRADPSSAARARLFGACAMSAAAAASQGTGEDEFEILCGDQEALRREWNRVRTERERTSSPGAGASPAGSSERSSGRADGSDSDSVVEGETHEWEEARSKRRKTDRGNEGRGQHSRTGNQDGSARANHANGWGSWFWQGFETVKLHDYLKRLAELRRRRAAQHSEQAHAQARREQETNADYDERWNTVAGFWRRKMAQNRDYVPSKRKKERSRSRGTGPDAPRPHGRSGTGSSKSYANWYSWRAQSSKSGDEFHRAGPSTTQRSESSAEAKESPGFRRPWEGGSAPHTARRAHAQATPHRSSGQNTQQHSNMPQPQNGSDKVQGVQDRARERVENLRTQQQEQAMQDATREKMRERVSKKLDGLRRPHVTAHLLLRAVGVSVEGGHCPTKKQIDVAMKKAMLRYHPDRCRGSHIPLEKQVESEEIFKLLNQIRQADARV